MRAWTILIITLKDDPLKLWLIPNVAGVRLETSLKRSLRHKIFPILKNICKRLFLTAALLTLKKIAIRLNLIFNLIFISIDFSILQLQLIISFLNINRLLKSFAFNTLLANLSKIINFFSQREQKFKSKI